MQVQIQTCDACMRPFTWCIMESSYPGTMIPLCTTYHRTMHGTMGPRDVQLQCRILTVHSEKNELLAFGHKWVKRWVFLEFFSAIPYGILFQLCFWSFFVQKASHSKNRISARFCPKSTELGKTIKIQAVWPRLQQCILRFEPQFRHPFWTLFQISKFAALHCVRWNHEKSPNTGARQSQDPFFYEWTVVTVRFKKIYNPGDRPRSLASYRMSTRALPGKTHCELEEIFRAKAGKMTTHSRWHSHGRTSGLQQTSSSSYR